jgi:ABA sandwich protein
MSDTPQAGRELDAEIAEKVMGFEVVREPMCAIFVEGEWSLHPDSSPDGWACYSGMEPVMVQHCRCQDGPILWSETGEEMDEWREQNDRETQEKWSREREKWGHSHHCLSVVPPYSTNITAAWEVVEKLNRDGFHCRITTPFHPGQPFFAGFTPHGMTGWNGRPDHEGSGGTAPLTICLAALGATSQASALPPEESR